MSEELKGQKVVFKVKVNEIKTRVERELNEEFFEDLAMDEIKSKEDLENMIKEQITSEKERNAENKYIDELLEKASSNMEVEIDEELITINTSLTDELDIDSLDLVDLVMTVEDEFSIELPDEALEGMKTIGDLVKYIEEN